MIANYYDLNSMTITATVAHNVTTEVVIYRRYEATPAFYDPYEALELAADALKKRPAPFFSAKALAEMPSIRPVQAPPRKPAKHLLHFANPRVWTRRNRPGI